MTTTTRAAAQADLAAISAVAAALPQWFTPEGVGQLTVDVANTRCAVIEDTDSPGRVFGFVSWYTYLGIGHIAWMGVEIERHRRGAGRALLRHCEDALRASGAAEVRVETLGEAVEYEPYARTRAFYYALGFSEFSRGTSDNPSWGEQLILSKRLVD